MRDRRNLILSTAVIVALAVPLSLSLATAPKFQAQAPASPAVPQWQIDAGGKMAFDVASIKPDKSGGRRYSNIAFNAGPTFVPTGGLLSVKNYPLINYILFAYKLGDQQFLYAMVGLPDWANVTSNENFDLEARAEGNVTKDQMRLMVQSLLADRFKLAMHHETRQGRVLALVLSKLGKIGPQLQQHSDEEPCQNAPTPGHGLPRSGSSVPAPSAPSDKSGLQLEPIPCAMVVGVRSSAGGRVRLGGRNVTMEQIGQSLGGDDAIDRPVIDRTGLPGTFDFTLEWSQQITFPDLRRRISILTRTVRPCSQHWTNNSGSRSSPKPDLSMSS